MENDIWIYHIVLFLFGFHLEFNLISKGSVVVATVDSWKFQHIYSKGKVEVWNKKSYLFLYGPG
jgi:hypothetical protein